MSGKKSNIPSAQSLKNVSAPLGSITAGGAIFSRLKVLGVEYVFVNSGTDFPPIVEGLAEAAEKDYSLPKPVIIPHEMAAVGMAHGYYLGSSKPQCVMLHTNVGLSNGVTGIINAACDRVPLIVMSGRTPSLEKGRLGARTVPIGWGQEMFDQASLVRECTKWDYELRYPEQLIEVIDRACAIACSTPKGPVYLSLPREILCEKIYTNNLEVAACMQPSVCAPEPNALAEASKLLKTARNPLIIGQNGINDAAVFNVFDEFVSQWAIPVSQYWPIKLTLPFNHPMSLGVGVTEYVNRADVILVLDALAPWWPDMVQPRSSAKIIQLGPDPLFSSTPIRNFRTDISLVGETAPTVQALIEAMGSPDIKQRNAAENRRPRIEKLSSKILRETRESTKKADKSALTTKDYVAHCLTRVLADKDYAVFSELGVPPGAFEAAKACSWFQEPPSGGLGWAFPASLGYKLSRPEKIVVATMGDGSYMFANPTVCHQIAESLELPVIVLVLNNQEWGAVRDSVIGLYPDGYAAQAAEVPLTSLKPSPDFSLTAQASRAHIIKVQSSEEVENALRDAVDLSEQGNAQVFVEIAIQ